MANLGPDAVDVDSDDCALYGESETAEEEEGEEGGDGDEDESTEAEGSGDWSDPDWSGPGDDSDDFGSGDDSDDYGPGDDSLPCYTEDSDFLTCMEEYCDEYYSEDSICWSDSDY